MSRLNRAPYGQLLGLATLASCTDGDVNVACDTVVAILAAPADNPSSDWRGSAALIDVFEGPNDFQLDNAQLSVQLTSGDPASAQFLSWSQCAPSAVPTNLNVVSIGGADSDGSLNFGEEVATLTYEEPGTRTDVLVEFSCYELHRPVLRTTCEE